ncbi:uncharacterized protein [Maniola hyperantus]|uniref:uncharacterized protein isoform X2 n=1 Tax=Aphantopus hyperantus TaxID=2795564 RepID=UPI00374863E7
MKTSPSQFDLMVTFMEQHGDLSKPSSNARGRISTLSKWEELAVLLNSDGSGDTKTPEKWKKGIHNEPDSMMVEQGTPSLLSQFVEIPLTPEVLITNIASPELPSQRRAMCSPPLGFIEEEVHDPGMRTPTRPSTARRLEPALSGQTTPRRGRPTQARGSQRKRVRPAHTQQAAEHFLQAEEFWRKFKIEQHRDYMDLRREQNRIREMEVQVQTQWQAVGLRALDILDKIANKYCKD